MNTHREDPRKEKTIMKVSLLIVGHVRRKVEWEKEGLGNSWSEL